MQSSYDVQLHPYRFANLHSNLDEDNVAEVAAALVPVVLLQGAVVERQVEIVFAGIVPVAVAVELGARRNRPPAAAYLRRPSSRRE